MGTIIDVQCLDESQTGTPKRYFDLADPGGHWISCCALGQHALSKALIRGNQAVLYFVSGRPQMGQSKACVYLNKDAVLVLVQARVVVPTKLCEIVLSHA